MRIGKQGMILESVPSTAQSVKVLLDGEKSMKVFSKAQLLLLNDLVKIQSFIDIYGRKEVSSQHSSSRESSRSHRESSQYTSSRDRPSSSLEPSNSYHETSSHSRHSSHRSSHSHHRSSHSHHHR